MSTCGSQGPPTSSGTLQKQGGAILGVEPGGPNLVGVSLIPEALLAGGVTLPYKIGGGSVLIVVCTLLDIQNQVRDLSLTNPGSERQ